MIQETYCTYDTAKLLREAGFPQKNGELTKYYLPDQTLFSDQYADYSQDIAAPTLTQAMRWLRDLNDDIPSTLDIASVPKNGMWVDKTGTGHCKGVEYWLVHHAGHPHFDTYEQAAEAGIQAACRHLIEKGGQR